MGFFHALTTLGKRANRGGRGARPGVERLEAITLLSGDMVLAWNTVALDAVAVDHSTPDLEQGGPTRTARALAIVHAAIFDAVNSIDRAYQPYLVRLRAPRFASKEAAIARAGHDTLVALYPSQRATFDAALQESLAEIPDGPAERWGVAVGRFAARRILLERRNDGAESNPVYTAPFLPGMYQTYPDDMEPLGPGWGAVKPFVMGSAERFLMDPPPELSSVEYAAAYDEVKALGGDGVTTPTERTAEQTEIGIFWAYDGTPGIGTPPRLFNQIVQEVARQEGNTLEQNARLFALVNLAMADAGIAAWKSKYHYTFWRPNRGIPQLDDHGKPMDDGNPWTVADPNWMPLGSPYTNGTPDWSGFTPPFPAYTSGHATFGAAVFETLTRFYGRDDMTFTIVSDELNGVSLNPDGTPRPYRPRTFTSFSQAMEENGQSRIYLGVHWSFDKTQGIAQGQQIADYVFEHVLTPLSPSGTVPGRRPRR